jgi:plasmid stabilization system protein ParE
MTRYRIDVLGDIASVEAKLASNLKQVATTTSRKNAAIADAVRPALERKLASLRDELVTATERPMIVYKTSFRFDYRTDFPTQKELEQMDIPAFLRR